MVRHTHPQQSGGNISYNTNYPPQRFGPAGGGPPDITNAMLYTTEETYMAYTEAGGGEGGVMEYTD